MISSIKANKLKGQNEQTTRLGQIQSDKQQSVCLSGLLFYNSCALRERRELLYNSYALLLERLYKEISSFIQAEILRCRTTSLV